MSFFPHFFFFNSHFLVIENYASQKYALHGFFNIQAATLPVQFFIAAFVGSRDFIDSSPHPFESSASPVCLMENVWKKSSPSPSDMVAVGLTHTHTRGFRRAFSLKGFWRAASIINNQVVSPPILPPYKSGVFKCTMCCNYMVSIASHEQKEIS